MTMTCKFDGFAQCLHYVSETTGKVCHVGLRSNFKGLSETNYIVIDTVVPGRCEERKSHGMTRDMAWRLYQNLDSFFREEERRGIK